MSTRRIDHPHDCCPECEAQQMTELHDRWVMDALTAEHTELLRAVPATDREWGRVRDAIHDAEATDRAMSHAEVE